MPIKLTECFQKREMAIKKKLVYCPSPPRFEIGLKEGTKMIWKQAAVRLANVKVKNVGSYFEAQQILSSPALNQVRAHTNLPANVLDFVGFHTSPLYDVGSFRPEC